MKRRIVFIVLGLVFASLFWGGKKAFAAASNCTQSVDKPTVDVNSPFTMSFDVSPLYVSGGAVDPNCPLVPKGLNGTLIPSCVGVNYHNTTYPLSAWYSIPQNTLSYDANTNTVTHTKSESVAGAWQYQLGRVDASGGNFRDICQNLDVLVNNIGPACDDPGWISVTKHDGTSPAVAADAQVTITKSKTHNFSLSSLIYLEIYDANNSAQQITTFDAHNNGSNNGELWKIGNSSDQQTFDFSNLVPTGGAYTIDLETYGGNSKACVKTINICLASDPTCKGGTVPTPGAGSFDLCTQIPDPTLKNDCYVCSYPDYHPVLGKVNPPPPTTPTSIWTSVGCIKTGPSDIVSALVKLGLGIAGSAAVLMILVGGFMLSTSQGDTKRVGEAKELITSAVIGLLFIIFSVTLLKFIGITIFNLPGFG